MATAVLVASGAIALVVVWMIVRAIRLTVGVTAGLAGRIEPVLAAVREGRTPLPDEVYRLAADPATRSVLYRALRALGHADLFPAAQTSAEAIAESDLVVWLLHGNELGAAPDEIELVSAIDRAGPPAPGRYYLFRFKTSPPHWAAASGWMAGVAGPYAPGEEAFDQRPGRVFSRFEPFDSRSPEDHVAVLTRT
jgi:hypothetical protein